MCEVVQIFRVNSVFQGVNKLTVQHCELHESKYAIRRLTEEAYLMIILRSFLLLSIKTYTVRLALVAQLDAPSDWRPGGCGFNPRRGRQHSFMEIDHEIFSTVILSLPLIQEGQLSVSGERMCTILVNCLED